jgi:hypothetical protein
MRNKVRGWKKSKNPYTSTEATARPKHTATRKQDKAAPHTSTAENTKNKRADKQNYLRKQSPGSQHHS